MTKVLFADGAEGARAELVNPAQPPVAVIAREMQTTDLPPGVALTPIAPGQILGLQIDAPGNALPVALTGLEVGENLRFRTNLSTTATGAGQTLALPDEVNIVTKTGGVSVSWAAWTGGEPGRIVLLKHTSGGGSTSTLENDTGGTDGFLCPGGQPFVYGGSTALAGGTTLVAGFVWYDSQSSRWLVFPRGIGRAENATWTGDHTWNSANFAAAASASMSLSCTALLTLASVSNNLQFLTSAIERLAILATGGWRVAGATGTLGQVLVNTGGSTSPVWGQISQAGLNGGILAALLGTTPSVTNDVTPLSVGAITVPANTAQVGTTYIANLSVEFVHTAAATPTLTLEWLFGGTVVCTRVITVAATAGTFTLWVEGYFRHTTIGAASSARVSIRAICTAGATVNDQIGETTAAPAALNTTISRTLELRVRMTTAVAANSLTLHQATIQRLINM